MTVYSVARRSRTVLRELPYFPYLIIPPNVDVPWSELGYRNYSTAREAVTALTEALLPIYHPFAPVPHIPIVMPPESSAAPEETRREEVWFFLNGICTNHTVLQLNGEALASIFGRQISLLHNPTDGIVLDLLECLAGRTYEIFEPVSRSVADILETVLKVQKKKVVLIAHSQGGIISSQAVNRLRERLSEEDRAHLRHLELYTFASAATQLEAPEVYTEHFYNTRDYVARIGVASYEHQVSGRFFTLDTTGHLMNAHYLYHFVSGRYQPKDGGDGSRLAGYMTAGPDSG